MSSLLDRLWYQVPSSLGYRLLGMLLEPLSWMYRAALSLKGTNPVTVGVGKPVISVGNLSVGGTGKTPLVVELTERLHQMGKRVAVVSRGYGRKSRGVLVVQKSVEDSLPVLEAGDEPLFIAQRCSHAAVVVGEDRVQAAQKALEVIDPDLIVCDDAFQHRRLHRDLDVVVVHARKGFGNRNLLPRGPLREPTNSLKRADLVIFTYADGQDTARLRCLHGIPKSITALACDLVAEGLTRGPKLVSVDSPPNVPMLAVCGVADPLGFFSSCRRAGLSLVGQMCFSDHHFFRTCDLTRIESRARQCKAKAVVVTEKDLVRLPENGLSLPVYGLRLGVRWHKDGSQVMLDSLLSKVLGNSASLG